MRLAFLLLSLPLAGCLGDATTDGGVDASQKPDLVMKGPPGGPGAPCQSVCDCGPGLGCNPNLLKCERALAPAFCCTALMCPPGAMCSLPDGRPSQCAGPQMPDGGPPADLSTMPPPPDLAMMPPPPDGAPPPRDGAPPGPKPCTMDSDCVGACPPGAIGCACTQPPMGGKVCTPTCKVNADCPKGPMGALVCHNGICAP
jgi:hypothetical protein